MTEQPKTPTTAAEWDDRYRGDHVWSGHVNGSLEAQISEAAPGTALDIGCGEGADAMWLAARGWTVTALDISAVAVERAEAKAKESGLAITWIAGNILDEPPAETFDLVSVQYPAFDIRRLDEAITGLCGAVAAGGILLVVGHDNPDDGVERHYDPAEWVHPSDLAARLTDGWEIEVNETRPRPGDHHHGSPDDVILQARRRS